MPWRRPRSARCKPWLGAWPIRPSAGSARPACWIAEWYRIADAIGAQAPASTINQVRGIIAERFADPELSTRGLASQLGLHRGSLSRLFHREAGCTLVDYVAKVRLQEARSLLQHGDESLSGIARQCGLRDASYFGRWFKKLSGTTPASYRREHSRRP